MIPKRFTKYVYMRVAQEYSITSKGKSLLLALVLFSNKFNQVTKGYDELQVLAGISNRNTLSKAVKELKDNKLVHAKQKRSSKTGNKLRTEYTLIVPSLSIK